MASQHLRTFDPVAAETSPPGFTKVLPLPLLLLPPTPTSLLPPHFLRCGYLRFLFTFFNLLHVLLFLFFYCLLSIPVPLRLLLLLLRKWTNGMLRLFDVWFLFVCLFLLLPRPPTCSLAPSLSPSLLPQPLTTWMTYDVETVHLHAEHRGAPPPPPEAPRRSLILVSR